MKYVSIDIETTGLNPETDQILEFGAIIEDTNKRLDFENIPKFRKLIYHEKMIGDLAAISMNCKIIQEIYDLSKKRSDDIIYSSQLAYLFSQFLIQNNVDLSSINIAGKNFGTFDKLFLNKIGVNNSFWNSLTKYNCTFNRRYLDPTMLYVRWDDEELPNLSECKRRAGLHEHVSHTSLEDAWDVILLLRNKY